MADTFAAKARKFMGWPMPEDIEGDDMQFDEFDSMTSDSETPVVELPTVAPLRRPVADEQPKGNVSRIVTVHPSAYSDAVTVGEAFRSGIPVIINLSEMHEDEARRLIDFAAGLTFGLHGVIERVTNRVFLLSPSTIEVTGDVAGSRRGSLYNQG